MSSSSYATADRWIRWTTTSSVILVAGIAAVVSYRHMHKLALRHGESELGAMLIPLAVDGMIVASSMSILLASRYGRRGGVLAWLLLIVGSLASLGANVAVADATLIARIIAAWPSFALIGAYEMLMGQVRQRHAIREMGTCAPHESSGMDADLQDLRRTAWRWALANRSQDGSLPSGAVIATQFSRSARWGRWIKRAGAAGDLG
ncbi:DUF2637 domain-containing protein [Nonomuraea sp. NPDC049152]|uniref:DUF2637 domain-containing protein n=1 Tax=Nonomuraea sp. NPDC049152 TaxID=3154350 RepID=UPI0033C3D6D6